MKAPINYKDYVFFNDNYAYIIFTTIKNGRTPLHYACSHGLYETVEYLIESGADINAATDVNSP